LRLRRIRADHAGCRDALAAVIPGRASARTRNLPCLVSSDSGAVPGLSGSEYGVGEDDQASQHGNECELWGFAFGDQAFVERPQDGIVPTGTYSGHIENAPHVGPASEDAGWSGHSATLVDERSDPNQRCCGLVVDPSQLRDGSDEGKCGLGP